MLFLNRRTIEDSETSTFARPPDRNSVTLRCAVTRDLKEGAEPPSD
jgi:hypothetical protein